MYNPITGTGTGIAPVVNLTFDFISKDDVKATAGGASVAFTWTGASQITFSAPVAAGVDWIVFRDTPVDLPLVDFTNGSVLSEQDLDLANQQLLYHQQELDTRTASTEVAVDAQAAAAASAALASASQAGAATSASNAATSAADAAASALDAANSASSASGSGSPMFYGAVGDGVADDRAAFVQADTNLAAGHVITIDHPFKIGSDLTISRPLVFQGAGKLVIPTGVTVTINGTIEAPSTQIFSASGTGKVVFDHTKVWHGFADWWGAAPGPGDSYAGITAALEALLTVFLKPGDYNVSQTIKLTQSHKALIGAGMRYNSSTDQATRLLVSGSSQTALQVGPDAFPGSINAMPEGLLVKDLYVTRTVAPDIASDSVGVLAQYVRQSRMERVKSAEHMVSFRFGGTVYLKGIDLEAVRASAGTGAGTDYWRGFHADGSAAIGAAGGNASLYLVRPSASCNIGSLQTGDSNGFHITGAFTDVFLDWAEVSTTRLGIAIFGNDAVGNVFTNTDLHISHPILDQVHTAGLYISDIGEAGSVDITNPYIGPATDARAAVWVNSSLGAVRIDGGQLVMGGAPLVQPVLIDTSDNVTIDGTMILEAGNTYPIVGMGSANNCRISPRIKNRSVTAAAAIQLSGTCTGNVIDPMIAGKASAFTYGIQVVGTADARNEYRVGGIDSTSLAVASRKLSRNGVDITQIGSTDTNYVSGTELSAPGSGTAFPASPAGGQRFFRTDRGIEYYWSASAGQWLSIEVFHIDGWTNNVSSIVPYTNTGSSYAANPEAGRYSIFVEEIHAVSNNGSLTPASNYYSLDFYKYAAGQAQIGTTISTSGDTRNTWAHHSQAINAVYDNTHLMFEVVRTITGSPSSIMTWDIRYRLVG